MMLVYLATPYANPDPEVMHQRFISVTRTASELIEVGYMVFSPITHGHPICLASDSPIDSFEQWEKFDLFMLSNCDKVMVLKLEGWEQSRGVRAEIEFAIENNIPVEYIS